MRSGSLPAICRHSSATTQVAVAAAMVAAEGTAAAAGGSGAGLRAPTSRSWQEAAVAVPPGSYLAFYTQGLLERGKGDLRRIFGRAPDEEPPRPGAGPVDLVRDHILASIDPLSVSSGNLD